MYIYIMRPSGCCNKLAFWSRCLSYLFAYACSACDHDQHIYIYIYIYIIQFENELGNAKFRQGTYRIPQSDRHYPENACFFSFLLCGFLQLLLMVWIENLWWLIIVALWDSFVVSRAGRCLDEFLCLWLC